MTAEAVEFEGVPPAFVYRPPRVRSLLPEVTKVCRTVDRELEPEQALAVDVITGLKADGSPASLSGAVISARQNLKTYVIEDVVLTRLVDPRDPSRLFVWTAQSLDACQESFLHLKGIFEGFPHMRRRLAKISQGKGSEEIELRDGKRLKFKARSDKSGQALTGDVIVLDEAFALEPAHLASLLPTLSTRRRATILYGSSAGHPGSAVLRGVRDRGRAGGRGAPAYVEWCAPGSWDEPGCKIPNCRHTTDMPGCVLDDREAIQLANPMAGRRITWEYLADERHDLPPAEFARERLGWWDEPLSDVQPISAAKWVGLAVEGQVDGQPSFFLDCAPGLRSASIAGATLRNGRPHVKLAEHQLGTDWVPACVAELQEKYPSANWQYESTGPASALAEQLKTTVGVTVEKPFNGNDMARGCAHLQKLVDDKAMTHSGDESVTVALGSAVKRDIGDPGLWSWGRRKSSGDISPLVAVTGALWLLETSTVAIPRIF